MFTPALLHHYIQYRRPVAQHSLDRYRTQEIITGTAAILVGLSITQDMLIGKIKVRTDVVTNRRIY